MSVQAKQISVSGTVPTALAAAATGDTNGMDYRISNPLAGTVAVGGATVAGTSGYRLVAGASTWGHLTAGEAIYGIVASGTVVCDVISTSL